MNRKFIVAILLVTAVPVCAQAQNPKVSTGDAQKVATIISGDKAKTQAYCDIRKLSEQIEEASAKKDDKTVEELALKIEDTGKSPRSRICRIGRWTSGHRRK
jgi:peptidoglycan hydrolase CwlO-like protein